MDDRPIDPFNPYARRYSPQEWPAAEPALDDTQDIPVVPAPGMDDTQEVPVVPRQAVGPPEFVSPVQSAVTPSEFSPPQQAAVPPSEFVPPMHAAVPPPEFVPPPAAVPPPASAPPFQAAMPPHEPVPAVSPEPATDAAPPFAMPGQPQPAGPPQWPTGVREPTTAVPAPPTSAPPFGPELTVPADMVPPRPGGKSVRKPLIAVGAGIAVVVALVSVVLFAMTPDSGGDGPDQATESSAAPEETGEESSSSAKESKSPSKNPKPESGKSTEPEPTDEADDDDPPPDQQLSVPSRPTKFGAWFAGGGTYEAKWGRPSDDGGSDILAYIVGDCHGNDLGYVDSNTYRVTVNAEYLDCMSVYAVNGQGTGADAQHPITNNP